MALVLRSDVKLKNPQPNQKKLPDTTSGLVLCFKASDLQLNNGDSVNNWIATGSGGLNIRTLNTTTPNPGDGSTMEFPKYTLNGPNGSPCVSFNGKARLSSYEVSDDIQQPTTQVVVFKYNPDTVGSSARIIGGIITGRFNSILPSSTSGQILLNGGAQVSTGFRSSAWAIAIVVFNGAASKWKFNTGKIVTGNAGGNSQRGITMGANASVLNAADSPGAIMDVCEFSIFSRALSDDDIEQMYFTLARRYGL